MAEFDSVIPAGGSGKLVAKVHTRPTQNGRVTKSVSVTTDAPKVKTLRLQMTFVAVAPIVMKPAARLYVNTVEGEGKTSRVLLHRNDGEPLVVKKVDVGDPESFRVRPVAAKAGEQYGAQEGDVWLEASVLPEDPVRRRDTTVKVYTNHPERPVIDVPVTIWVRGLVEAKPDRVSLWLMEGNPAGRSTTIRVSHNAGRPFEIKDVESSRPELIQATSMTSDARMAHTLRIELTPDVDPASLQLPVNATLRITSSESLRPVVEVPVTISERSRRLRQPYRPARPPAARPTPAKAKTATEKGK